MVRRNYRGMRKGLSIVEMMVAVILFGVISTIGYKYSKNFYNVSLASKQALIAAVIDQATQLSNAYDIYQIKLGIAADTVGKLSGPTVKILTKTPEKILAITADGWELTKINVDGDGGATDNDTVFSYKISSSTASNLDKLTFCNVLNNIEYSDYSLDTALGDIGTADTMYDGSATAANNHEFKELMCYKDSNDNLFLTFVKELDPS